MTSAQQTAPLKYFSAGGSQIADQNASTSAATKKSNTNATKIGKKRCNNARTASPRRCLPGMNKPRASASPQAPENTIAVSSNAAWVITKGKNVTPA